MTNKIYLGIASLPQQANPFEVCSSYYFTAFRHQLISQLPRILNQLRVIMQLCILQWCLLVCV